MSVDKYKSVEFELVIFYVTYLTMYYRKQFEEIHIYDIFIITAYFFCKKNLFVINHLKNIIIKNSKSNTEFKKEQRYTYIYYVI